jgi:hypothetical protein
MEILILIVKTVIAYLIISLLNTNLLGLFVRGIIPSYLKDLNGDLIEIDNKLTRFCISFKGKTSTRYYSSIRI